MIRYLGFKYRTGRMQNQLYRVEVWRADEDSRHTLFAWHRTAPTEVEAEKMARSWIEGQRKRPRPKGRR